MKQLLTGKQMKQADTWSIKEFGMESLILMERAALCAAQHIMSVQKPGCVFIMCGMGNNGADGLAMARTSHKTAGLLELLLLDKSRRQRRNGSIKKHF